MPKLLDFGIAKLIHTEFSTLPAAETRPELRPMTLDYASPEQVRGESITTATDVYSLGVLLYKLLTGKFPYGPDVKSRRPCSRPSAKRNRRGPAAWCFPMPKARFRRPREDQAGSGRNARQGAPPVEA